MKKIYFVKIINSIVALVLSIVLITMSVFCRNISPDSGGIDKEFLKKYTVEEWNTLDNDSLTINEIEKRIRYFSPTYLSLYDVAYDTAEANIRTQGVDRPVVDTLQETSRTLQETIKSLKKIDPTNPTIIALEVQKAVVDKMNTTMFKVNDLINPTIEHNNKLNYGQYALCKGMEIAFVSYLLLEKYSLLFEKKEQLNKDLWEISKKKFLLGSASQHDVNLAYSNYVSSVSDTENMKQKRDALKRQIALTLGFEKERVNDLEFVEPEVDFDYLMTIDKQKDTEAAYNSNTTYNGAAISDYSRAGGLKQEQRQKFRDYIKDKVTIEMDGLYNDIEVKHKEYDASLVAKKLLELNKLGYENKKKNGFLSNSTDQALSMSLLNDEISIYNAKYNFIQALTNYRYATLGVTQSTALK